MNKYFFVPGEYQNNGKRTQSL